jgi:Ca2+-dependent lipid-binding protein
MDLGKGLLTVKVEEGKLNRDTEMVGSMSPYCTIVFKSTKIKTKVHSNGGKTPVWGDEFVLETEDPTEEMVLRVWDQDMTTSDAIGFTKVKMSSLMINMGTEDWYTIMFDNKPAGEIKISSVFEPEGGDAFEEMQEKHAEQTAALEAEAEAAKE